MKQLYIGFLMLLVFKNSFGSYSYNSSHSYGNNSSHDSSSSYQQVKQEPKQEGKTSYEKSFEYAQKQFSTFDTSSQQLRSDVMHALNATKEPHEYGMYLGMVNALTIMACAVQNPLQASEILKAAYEDPKIQKIQQEFTKNNIQKNFPQQNVEKSTTIAQNMTNGLVRASSEFLWEGPEIPLLHNFNKPTSIRSTSKPQQLPGLKHIKEFVSKFSQLSTEGKKIVGNLFLVKNVTEAFKVIAQGNKSNSQAVIKRSVYERVVNPKVSSFIKETSQIIKVASREAVHDTVHLFSFVPNIVGASCLATKIGSDLYLDKTTFGEIVFHGALAYGVLKGVQLTGKGIKFLYQHGKDAVQKITHKKQVSSQLNRLRLRAASDVGAELFQLKREYQEHLLEIERILETLPVDSVFLRSVVEQRMSLEHLEAIIAYHKTIEQSFIKNIKN